MKLASQLGSALDTLTLGEIDQQILVVKLDRPEVSNAISTTMGQEIIRVFGALEAVPTLYRCVILTGAG